MGKTTGFKEFSRAVEPYRPVKERLLDFKEITLTMMMKNYRFKVRDVWIVVFLFVSLVKDVLFTT